MRFITSLAFLSTCNCSTLSHSLRSLALWDCKSLPPSEATHLHVLISLEHLHLRFAFLGAAG